MSRSRILRRSYKTYSVACFVVWAAVLVAAKLVDPPHTTHAVLLVFAGWTLGWLSATIARSLYPHPGAKLR